MSNFQKPIVFMIARQHPFETSCSYLMDGFLRAMVQDTKALRSLLELCEIHIVPMLNVDGVIAGNSRVNLAGQDLNRQWHTSADDTRSEVTLVKRYLLGF